MDADNGKSTHHPEDPGRLNGWKEISAFLGKGVRTAQRWERVFGMPVHRLGHKGGEIVFAYRDELAEWLRTTETDAGRNGENEDADLHAPASHSPSETSRGPETVQPTDAVPGARQWPRTAMLALLGIVVVASVVVGLREKATSSTAAVPALMRQPSQWKVSGNRLQVLDTAGALVWEHRFDFEINEPGPGVFARQPLHVLLRDLEGDGKVETVFTALAHSRFQRDLYCFNSDGSVRFKDRPDGSVIYGDKEYDPPWLGYQLFVTKSATGTPHLWSEAIHGLWFPARLRKLDASGGLVSEYWSNGYIESVVEAEWQGQRRVFVGGTNNESRGASLAVFDADAVTGSAPASDPAYVCHTCPPGGPVAFLVFPQSCITRASDDQPFVAEAWPDGDQHLKVMVTHPFIQQFPTRVVTVADVVYTLDSDLRLVQVERPREFEKMHARLVAHGELDHPFSPDEERDLARVMRWNGTTFERVASAPGEGSAEPSAR